MCRAAVAAECDRRGGLWRLDVPDLSRVLKSFPSGFIPEQDKGYLVVNAQLPDGANLDRSDQLVRQLSKTARETKGVAHTIDLAGYSTILSTNISNAAGCLSSYRRLKSGREKRNSAAPAIQLA